MRTIPLLHKGSGRTETQRLQAVFAYVCLRLLPLPLSAFATPGWVAQAADVHAHSAAPHIIQGTECGADWAQFILAPHFPGPLHTLL